tara:strand:- start:788 stop:1420 length:633 start_codon:yes stop_codon:yes gene_type:complete
METLWWLLGYAGSETVKDYISSPDEDTALLTTSDTAPKTYRIKEMSHSFVTTGSPAGKVAHMVIDFEVKKHGYELDLEAPDSSCNRFAFSELLDQLHESIPVQLFRVDKTVKDITSCISNGRPVAIALPVTEDIFDKRFVMPRDHNVFGFIPVVLWAYSMAADTFIAYVPLDAYDTHIKIPFKHVLCEDSCDLYCVVLEDHSEEEPLFLN